jgi:Acetyltransferase (GNAT) domain
VSADVRTRVLGEDEYARWTQLVAAAPGGGVYSRPDYIAALCHATGATFRVLVAERERDILAGIVLYERPSRLGPYVWPRRLLYYNGFVLIPSPSKYPSQRTSTSLQALSAIEQALSGLGYTRLRVKSRALEDVRLFQERGWGVEPTYTYVVDIADLDVAWSRVDKNQRRLITRCREQGVSMEVSDDFEAFYRLHDETHVRKGAELYLPQAAFREFFEALRAKGLCRLCHARLPDGRVAASQLVLAGDHPVTHTVAAGTAAEFLSLGVSSFLRWAVFEHLSREGYKANDLTDAALNPVTHFKSQLGGDLVMNFEVWKTYRALAHAADEALAFAGRARRALRRRLLPATRRPT